MLKGEVIPSRESLGGLIDHACADVYPVVACIAKVAFIKVLHKMPETTTEIEDLTVRWQELDRPRKEPFLRLHSGVFEDHHVVSG